MAKNDLRPVRDAAHQGLGPAQAKWLRQIFLMALLLAPPLGIALPPPADGEVWAQVEIPAGAITKYEIDPDAGKLIVDRFQTMPVVYPANYGQLPATQAADGDALDVLVLSREPIMPGAYIRVRPIGVLKMRDGGEDDDKIIAVPADDVDPDFRQIREMDDLPTAQRDRIEAFFRVYKQLPAGRKKVELDGFRSRAAAWDMVRGEPAEDLDSAP